MDVLKPIREKIKYWIDYEEHKPANFRKNKIVRDNYRGKNDLDCILLDGDLHADTIISLWLPLRGILVKLNSYPKLNRLGKVGKNPQFLRNLQENLSEYLPPDNETVIILSTLFELGQRRCNVMKLPNRWMQSRGQSPYFDYMPYFLSECFEKGDFAKYFKNDEDFIAWVKQEKLQVFFKEKNISRENILDLSGNGIMKNIPENWLTLFKNYIQILEERERLLEND